MSEEHHAIAAQAAALTHTNGEVLGVYDEVRHAHDDVRRRRAEVECTRAEVA